SYSCLIVAEGQALCNSQGESTRMEILAHRTLLWCTLYGPRSLGPGALHFTRACRSSSRCFNCNIGWKISPLSHTQIIMVAVEQPEPVQARLSRCWYGVTMLTGHAIL